MAKRLAELQKEIMLNTNVAKDWQRLGSEVDEAMSCATDEEIQKFVDSGAGEVLDMSCSAIQKMQMNS